MGPIRWIRERILNSTLLLGAGGERALANPVYTRLAEICLHQKITDVGCDLGSRGRRGL